MVSAIAESVQAGGVNNEIANPVFSNVTLTGKTQAYQLEVTDRTFLKDVTITGVVTGLNLNGVVTDTRFNSYTSDLSTRLNNMDAYASTTRGNAESAASTLGGRVSLLEAGLSAAKEQADKVPAIQSSLLTVSQTVGDNTGGLVRDSISLRDEVKPDLANARERVSTLEEQVNGVNSSTGLVNQMSNVVTRASILETQVDDLNTKVKGPSGLLNRVSAVETQVTENFSTLDSKIEQKVTDLLDGAPEQFNTLKELANALNDQTPTSVVSGILAKVDLKANITALDGYLKKSSTTAQEITGPVQFTGEVTGSGLKAINISAADVAPYSDTTSVAAKLQNRVDLDTVQTIYASKAFTNKILLKDPTYLVFGESLTGSVISLQEKLSQTTISSTQNFQNGLTVPEFNQIKATTPNQLLGTELYARLDTRSSAGEPEINSKPVFKEGCRLLNASNVFIGNQSNPTDTLQEVIDRTQTNKAGIASLNTALNNYPQLTGSHTFQSGTKTFAGDAYILMDPSNLTFRASGDNDSPPVTLTTLLGRDRVMYLTGTDTQTVSANKKFSGQVELAYDTLTLNRTKDNIATTVNAKDFVMNTLDNQSITGVKSFVSTGGASFQYADQLTINNTTIDNYAVTVNNANANSVQQIKGAKWFDAKTRIYPANLKFMEAADSTEATDVDAATYIVNTSKAQNVLGKKDFSGGNGLVVTPDNLFFKVSDGTEKSGTSYLVNRLDAQIVAGKKTFSSGVVLPMDITELKVDANSIGSVYFKDYVASKTEAQTISGATTFSGDVTVNASKLKFQNSTPTASFSDFVSKTVLLEGEQTFTGKKIFSATNTLEITPSALYVKDSSVNSGNAMSSTDYFMNLYSNQDVLGTKNFGQSGKLTIHPSNLTLKASTGASEVSADQYFMTSGYANATEAEQTVVSDKKFSGKLTVADGSKFYIGSTKFSDLLSDTNVMYLAGSQTVAGNKSFNGITDVVGTNFKIRATTSDTASNSLSIMETFVTTNGSTMQTINGQKKMQCLLDFPLNGTNEDFKIRIPMSQLLVYTSGDPFSEVSDSKDLQYVFDGVRDNAKAIEDKYKEYQETAAIVTTYNNYKSNYFDKNSSAGQQIIQSTVKIPAANLTLTDGSTEYSASTLIRKGVSNDLGSTTELKISSSNVLFNDTDFPNVSLLTKFGEFIPKKTDDIVKLESATVASTSKIQFADKKQLEIRDTQLLLRKTDSVTTSTDVKTYVNDSIDSRLDVHMGTATVSGVTSKKLVYEDKMTINFQAGTSSTNKQNIVLSEYADLKVNSASNIVFTGASADVSTLAFVLGKKQDAPPSGNFITEQTADTKYVLTTNIGGYFKKAVEGTAEEITSNANFNGTYQFNKGTAGSTKTVTFGGSSVDFDTLLTSTRIVEKFATATVSNNACTIDLSQAGVFLLGSTLTAAGTINVNNLGSPLTANRSHSFAVLIPFTGNVATKYYINTVNWPNTTSPLTVLFAGGSGNLDMSLTNSSTSPATAYVLQTFTIFPSSSTVCLSSVALFV